MLLPLLRMLSPNTFGTCKTQSKERKQEQSLEIITFAIFELETV